MRKVHVTKLEIWEQIVYIEVEDHETDQDIRRRVNNGEGEINTDPEYQRNYSVEHWSVEEVPDDKPHWTL